MLKTQELGPCPLLVVSWEEEVLDLHLEIRPRGPGAIRHALIKVNLCITAHTRPFQTRENCCYLFSIGGSGVGGGNPDLGLRPPFVELLWQPVVKFGRWDNFLRTSGPSVRNGSSDELR